MSAQIFILADTTLAETLFGANEINNSKYYPLHVNYFLFCEFKMK